MVSSRTGAGWEVQIVVELYVIYIQNLSLLLRGHPEMTSSSRGGRVPKDDGKMTWGGGGRKMTSPRKLTFFCKISIYKKRSFLQKKVILQKKVNFSKKIEKMTFFCKILILQKKVLLKKVNFSNKSAADLFFFRRFFDQKDDVKWGEGGGSER